MSAGAIQVAEGGVLDLPAVMAVMEDGFDPAYGEAWTAPQCAGLLPMNGVWLLLARDGDCVVGFALSRIVIAEAELLLLAVRRNRRRSGIGQLLLDHFTTTALRRGASQLHLEVRDGNHAINLYKRAGFQEVGRRRNYYRGRNGELFDALTLGKHARS